MITVEECIKFAEECEEMAEDPNLTQDRDQILKIARMWRELAVAQHAEEASVH